MNNTCVLLSILCVIKTIKTPTVFVRALPQALPGYHSAPVSQKVKLKYPLKCSICLITCHLHREAAAWCTTRRRLAVVTWRNGNQVTQLRLIMMLMQAVFIGHQQESDSDESPNTYDSKQFCIIACTETI